MICFINIYKKYINDQKPAINHWKSIDYPNFVDT